jgi:hypothetical protein
MQTLKLSEKGVKELSRRKILKFLLITATLISIIAYINLSIINTTEIDLMPLLSGLGFMILIMGISVYRGLANQMALLRSYTIVITDTSIKREQLNTPTITLDFDEVVAINQYPNGSLEVIGPSINASIVIPHQIENRQDIERNLNKIKSLTLKAELSFFTKYLGLFIAIVVIGLMITIAIVDNKIIVALSGTTLISLLIWSLVKIQGSKHHDKRTKRSTWLSLLAIASLIAIIIAKLIN